MLEFEGVELSPELTYRQCPAEECSAAFVASLPSVAKRLRDAHAHHAHEWPLSYASDWKRFDEEVSIDV